MPAQLFLAGALALVWNVLSILNAKFALWADLRAYRALRAAAALRAERAALGWTLADAWEATLARTPADKRCVVCAETSRSFTFAAVERESNRVARWAASLRLSGAEPGPAPADARRGGATVALLLDSSPELVVFVLGLAKAGVAVALLDVDRRGERLADALRSSGARVLLFGGRFEAAVTAAVAEQRGLGGLALHLFAPERGTEVSAPAGRVAWAHAAMAALGDGAVAPTARLNCRAGLAPLAPCLRVESERSARAESGGTDWLTLTHAALLELASAGAAASGLRAADTLYCPLALEHLRGCAFGMAGMVMTGCSLVTRPSLETGAYWADCAELGCTALLHEGSTLALLAARTREPSEEAHSLRLAIGPALGKPIAALLQHRFLVPEARALLGLPTGDECALVLGVACAGAASAAVGASGRIGAFRSRRREIAIVQLDGRTGEPARAAARGGSAPLSAAAGAARGPPPLCVPCERGGAGLLLARAGPGVAELGLPHVRGVYAQADAYVSTGLVARHERFAGWVRVVGQAAAGARGGPPAVGPAEAARALAGADGLADAAGYTAALSGVPVCIVAVSTSDGGPPDVKALSSLLSHGLRKGARAPLLLRHVRSLAARSRTAEPRTAALEAQGADPAAHGDPMWAWDEEAELFAPFDRAAHGRLSSQLGSRVSDS